MGKQGLDLDGTQENRGTGSQTEKKMSVKIQEGEAWLVMKIKKSATWRGNKAQLESQT